jgi:hypothetical protein
MLLLGNVGQQLDIGDLANDVQHLAREVHRIDGNVLTGHRADQDAERTLAQLAAENQELKLYLAATVRLLVAKNVVTADELRTIVDEIDRSDGTADGKFTGPVAPP